MARRRAGSPGQRHVDRLLAQARAPARRGLERRGALLDQRLERLPGLVARACRPRAPLAPARARDRAQDLRQLRLAAQVPDPQLLELRRRCAASSTARSASSAIRSRRPRAPSPWSSAGSAARAQASAWHDIRTGRGSRSSRRSANRPAAATGTWAISSQAATISAGRPARSAPSTNSGGPVERERRAAARPAPGTSATAAPRAAARLVPRSRARPAAPKTAPMLARTALGPNGSAVRGLSTTRAGAERVRRPQDRPDVAGVGDVVEVERPVRVHGPVPPRCRALPDADHPRARCRAIRRSRAPRGRRGTRSTSAGSRASSASSAARSGVVEDGLAARAPWRSAASSMSSPSAMNRPAALAVLALAQLAQLLDPRVVCACDRLMSSCVRNTKKAARPAGRRPWRSPCPLMLRIRPRTPPGPPWLARQIAGRSRGRARRRPRASCG